MANRGRWTWLWILLVALGLGLVAVLWPTAPPTQVQWTVATDGPRVQITNTNAVAWQRATLYLLPAGADTADLRGQYQLDLGPVAAGQTREVSLLAFARGQQHFTPLAFQPETLRVRAVLDGQLADGVVRLP